MQRNTSNRSKRVNRKSEFLKNFVEKNIGQTGAELTRSAFERLLSAGGIHAAAQIPDPAGARRGRFWEPVQPNNL
jgi:hypothetical protein